MYVHFKEIRYQNFLSTGNQFTVIKLDKSPSTLVSGKNGSGKCLDPLTTAEISFADSDTEQKFLDFLAKSLP